MVRKVLLSMDSKNIDAYRRYRFAKQMRLNGSTLADIAATLHVSIDTVHRVLNGILIVVLSRSILEEVDV